jgi:hypothetical protein
MITTILLISLAQLNNPFSGALDMLEQFERTRLMREMGNSVARSGESAESAKIRKMLQDQETRNMKEGLSSAMAQLEDFHLYASQIKELMTTFRKGDSSWSDYYFGLYVLAKATTHQSVIDAIRATKGKGPDQKPAIGAKP